MASPIQQSTLMTVKDVCAEFKIGRTSLYAALNADLGDGTLKALKIGRSTRFRRSEVEAWFSMHPPFARLPKS